MLPRDWKFAQAADRSQETEHLANEET